MWYSNQRTFREQWCTQSSTVLRSFPKQQTKCCLCRLMKTSLLLDASAVNRSTVCCFIRLCSLPICNHFNVCECVHVHYSVRHSHLACTHFGQFFPIGANDYLETRGTMDLQFWGLAPVWKWGQSSQCLALFFSHCWFMGDHQLVEGNFSYHWRN